MLAGRASIDVNTAVRIARALQLPAERIMQMQLRHDFSTVRDAAPLDDVTLLSPLRAESFPEPSLHGRLGCSRDGAGADDSLFFRQDLTHRVAGDDYAGLHALWRGDRLRIYEPSGPILWTGPVLQDFDGGIMLPYAQPSVWRGWFAASYRADLALDAGHAANLARAHVA